MNFSNKTFYITSPLYYVNDVPHIGSAYTTIACDALSRFYRLKGFDTFFLTGTDEHGQKIFKAANDKGKSPQEHCDFISEEFKKLWKLLNIKHDGFIRTSSKNHNVIVSEFFNRVYQNGDIYESDYEGLYCEACEDFKLEKDLSSGLFCPIHKIKVLEYKEKNYFFKLSKFQERLVTYINENPDFIQPEFRKNEVMGWINEGLKDFPISRRSVKWGIPLPIDTSQTIYVWFDALLGYISGILEPDKEPNIDNAIKKYWPCSVHIIGKDILRFHAVYWPCMLMSAGLPIPQKVFGHGFLTKDGEKMGKTTGNIVNPYELINEFGTDAVRFFFLREIIFGRDGDFTRNNFINRINSDLANNLGNLLNRSLNIVNKNFNNEIGCFPESNQLGLREQFDLTLINFEKNLKDLNIKDSLDELWKLIDNTNRAFNDKAPWKLIKNNQLNEAECCLYEALEILRNISIMIFPFIPETSSKMYIQLGYDKIDERNEWENLGWGRSKKGFKIKLDKPVFPRIEAKV